LSVAGELRKRGHEILFAGESPKIRFIQQEGFEVLPLYEPDPAILFGNIRKGKLRFVSDAELERMLNADLALYKEAKPDIVLTDGRFTAPISTHIAGIRHAAIVNVSSTEYRANPYIPFFDWLPVKEDSNAGKALNLLNLFLEMAVFDNMMGTFIKLSKRYGLTKTITATNCLTGKDITLLADIPEYFPTRNLPANYHYIGPLTWERGVPPPSWWPPQKEGRPLIYITAGTTGIGDFFQIVYGLIRKSGLAAVITTGAQIGGLESIKGKIYAEPFIDGDLVMKECDLVVCHGGNGTIYQALQHGKPVIGIPTIPDQKFNMRRVEALAVGRTLSWKDFSRNPESLLALIDSVLREKSFMQNAERMRDILSGYNAAQTAADIIEKAMKRNA
ncbi:MAG: UDP glycosyltransferase, partial [Nitrospirales bacterium]|nr:UDP glycosyltransferase [Nitrospirales bacterium]